MLDFIVTHWVKLYALLTLIFLSSNWAMAKTFSKTERVDALERRLGKVEAEIEQLPTNKELFQLELKMENIIGQMNGISHQLLKLQKTTEMLLENELQGERK